MINTKVTIITIVFVNHFLDLVIIITIIPILAFHK